ncbi:MAG: hypothetical protein PHW98_06515, partial [Candidatus Omnitrophica bacterium]|nr:hypothetical protein [Candidatus Omnitrophota bacterium]MDD5771493.1 hypothetical protein [Candidatus Omnitrophota bacterium]
MNVRQELLSVIKNIDLEKVENPKKVSTYFGENTFKLETMQKHISKKTFEAFKLWMSEGKTISLE